jgi:hypothetical protein
MATIMIQQQQVLIRKGRYVHNLFLSSSIMLILSMMMIDNNFNIGVGVGVGVVNALTIPRVSNTPTKSTNICRVATSMMMTNEDIPDPSTFREAEVLGLRLMQEGSFDDALVGTLKKLKLLLLFLQELCSVSVS